MKTKNYEKKTIVTHAYCECGGEYYYNAGSLFTDLFSGKVKFEHTCKKCGKKVELDGMYPEKNEIEMEI